jgi:hypothetical protein
MSIEIEVGLENAAKVKTTTEERSWSCVRKVCQSQDAAAAFFRRLGGVSGGGFALPVLPQP